MQCSRCYKENEDSVAFCKYCGLLLVKPAPNDPSMMQIQEEEVNENEDDGGGFEVNSNSLDAYSKRTSIPHTQETVFSDCLEIDRLGGGLLNSIKHFILGGFFTLIFYYILIMHLGTDIAFVAKFTDRGWTPYAAVFLCFWSFSILLGKLINIPRRGKCLKATFIPVTARLDTDEGIGQAIAAVKATSERLKDAILGQRIQRAMEHFRASKSLKEACDILQEESDSDFIELESSYTLVRVFLWTIPILGFIGTVIGIGDAVGGFGSFLSTAREISEIVPALTTVTSGLGVAFDTTFVGLVLSVVVMIAMSTVEKMEKRQLQVFENYCQNHVIRRLSKVASAQGNGAGHLIPELIPNLEIWTMEAQKLAQSLAGSLTAAWEKVSREWFEGIKRIQKEVSDHYVTQQDALNKMAEERQILQKEAASLLLNIQELYESMQDKIRKVLEIEQSAVTEAVKKQHNMIQQYSGALNRVGGKLGELVELQNKLEDGLLRASGSDGLAAVIKDVRSTLQTLDPALHRLADKPLQVEVQFTANSPTVTGR
ncbi:MAG: MotA/TolQ/ExbB proton channel family protein [Candidatus Hodarchaeota archaeon]